jgi:hypothetical protein
MSLDEQIANLIRVGALKQAARDEALIRQYLANAEELRSDADAPKSAHSRFLLAYEALHALAMAFLTDRGLRTAGEGHRSVALQLSISELTRDAKVGGGFQAMIQIHNARNKTTYFQPIPPVSDKLAGATLKLLDAALAGAKAQIRLSGTPPAPGRSV